MNKPLCITMGDPLGIGPELVARTFHKVKAASSLPIRIYGDESVMRRAFTMAGEAFPDAESLKITSQLSLTARISDKEAAQTTISALNAAISDAMEGRSCGIVTMPVNKHRIQSVAPSFTGHTEYISQKANAAGTMVFVVERKTRPLFIGLVTTHIPLKNVADAITSDVLIRTIRATSDIATKYSKRTPGDIAVMSLNPHAGESGAVGREEIDVIAPALELARKEGLPCSGPLSADGLFVAGDSEKHDCIIAMYHDQAMLPAKVISGGNCVNITAGLPFIRTSPGHGTAEEIAWKNVADVEPCIAAIRVAEKLAGFHSA